MKLSARDCASVSSTPKWLRVKRLVPVVFAPLVCTQALWAQATKAAAGETILLFVNGVAPAPSGVMIPADIVYSGAVTVAFNLPGLVAPVKPSFTGLIEAGVYQMNVVVPATLPTGNYPLTVTVQGQSSPAMTILLPVQ